MAEKSALAKAADSAAEGNSVARTPAPAGGSAEDADLFGLELDAFEGATIRPAKRGPGRPPGSINRTTLQLQRVLMARGYRDPAEFLAAVMSMSTDELAKALGCKPVEALPHQLRAAAELMPYFHQAMPKAVEVKGDAPRQLIVMGDLVNGNVVTNQQVNHAVAEGSHDKGSHDDG